MRPRPCTRAGGLGQIDHGLGARQLEAAVQALKVGGQDGSRTVGQQHAVHARGRACAKHAWDAGPSPVYVHGVIFLRIVVSSIVPAGNGIGGDVAIMTAKISASAETAMTPSIAPCATFRGAFFVRLDVVMIAASTAASVEKTISVKRTVERAE